MHELGVSIAFGFFTEVMCSEKFRSVIKSSDLMTFALMMIMIDYMGTLTSTEEHRMWRILKLLSALLHRVKAAV